MASQELLQKILAEKLQNAQKQGYNLCKRDKKFLEVASNKKIITK